MIIVLPFHAGEIERVRELLSWCLELGGCRNHCAVLVADAAVPWVGGMELLEHAQRVFKEASMISPDAPITGGWPTAANRMFLFAAEKMQAEGQPWLWLEADAIPLRVGWLEALDAAYGACGKPFMGAVIPALKSGLPFTYLNGVAVYPANAYGIMEATSRNAPGKAFDVACAGVLLPQAADTPLVHCHWGLPDKPPVFIGDVGQAHDNYVTLSFIRRDAVLFHRNKDGSLIRNLRRKLFFQRGIPMTVVLPFCNRDAEFQLRNVRWMRELDAKLTCHALLLYPNDTLNPYVKNMGTEASSAFTSVQRRPYYGTSNSGWPSGANKAWQTAAAEMMPVGPWLWLEADANPLCSGWLDAIAAKYARCGKAFFGPIVEGRGHMNGVGIYPADTPKRCPKAMACTDVAFDYVMRPEMIHDCYDASRDIQHCWGIVGGKPHATDGNAAHFSSQTDLANWLDPNAVLFHRCKDGSLIDRLRERHNR